MLLVFLSTLIETLLKSRKFAIKIAGWNRFALGSTRFFVAAAGSRAGPGQARQPAAARTKMGRTSAGKSDVASEVYPRDFYPLLWSNL